MNNYRDEIIKLINERKLYSSMIYNILKNIDKDILLSCVNSSIRSIFVFNSKSADKPPGTSKPTGEYLKPLDEFTELSKIPNWRKVLSNFHYDPFVWKNRKWTCIEEAYQASKFGEENIDSFQKVFKLKLDNVLKNGCNIEIEAGKVAQSLRKWKILTNDEMNNWIKKSRKTMTYISISKSKYSKIFRNVLILTKDAKLVHNVIQRGKPSTKDHFIHLEIIRTNLIDSCINMN